MQLQRANIQSRRDNKRRTKDSSGWQDAPGAAMLLLCWKGLLSCGVGQLETGGLSGGGSRHNKPSMKCFQLREKDEQTFWICSRSIKKEKYTADDGGFMNQNSHQLFSTERHSV